VAENVFLQHGVRLRKFDSGGLTQLMHANLHWLDVPERVKYKVIVLTHRSRKMARFHPVCKTVDLTFHLTVYIPESADAIAGEECEAVAAISRTQINDDSATNSLH